jgi:hypothetical protein
MELQLILIPRKLKNIPGPNYKIADAIRKRLGRAAGPTSPAKSMLKQSRAFVLARVSGAQVKEAKQLAGISQQTTTANILERPETQAIILELSKEEEFRDPGITKRLKEMWHHKRVRLQKVGDDIEKIHEDDTDMWKFSMDRVLQLKGHLKRNREEETSNVIEASGGITFNVLQMPVQK